TAVAVVGALCLPRQRDFRPAPFRATPRSIIAREALVPALVMLFLSSGFAAVNAFVVLYGRALDLGSIGLFFTAYAVTVLAARPIAGR
ncbi:hypothetical protein ACMWP8_28325, partial [Escherichia coli]|uniref:hypothetical protein n=1 Tax=Escherichia coli TaxID=562 RepID=UPI0039DF6EF3